MLNDKKVNIKRILSIFYIVLIGAIGSGVWELFLKDLMYWFGEVFVRVASSIYLGYFDRLYAQVGKKFDLFIYLPSAFLLTIIIVSPFAAYHFISFLIRKFRLASQPETKKAEKFDLNRVDLFLLSQALNNGFRLKIIFCFPFVIYSLIFVDIFLVTNSSRAAVNVIERRLEIIRPYISENKYYVLVSNFRMIDSRGKMQIIINDIDKVAREQNIILPKFELYGIQSPTVNL